MTIAVSDQLNSSIVAKDFTKFQEDSMLLPKVDAVAPSCPRRHVIPQTLITGIITANQDDPYTKEKRCIPSLPNTASPVLRLSDKGRSSSGLVLKSSGDLLGLDVVSGETVDSRLNENHSARQDHQHHKSELRKILTHNLASLSPLFRSRCFRTETAFLMRW